MDRIKMEKINISMPTTATEIMQQNQTIVTTTPARFTKIEKQILYALFRENENIIDIKYRRNLSKKNCSVRECWDKIASDYNENPDITTTRNVKQIQKFWLNARLRKHYPSGSSRNANCLSTTPTLLPQPKPILKKFETVVIDNSNIKFEKECEQDEEEEEEVEMYTEEEDEHNMQHEVEISTSSNDVLLESTSQQFNIDHISAEKLTLNDLLEFKNSRSARASGGGGVSVAEEIVLQIKTPDPMGQHHHHSHQKDSNSGAVGGAQQSSVQTYTTTSYRLSNPMTILPEQFQQQQQQQQQQQPIIQHQQIIPPQLHHKSTANGGCCAYNNNNSNNNSNSRSPAIDSFEEKINFYQLKEAELKYKEEQLKWEQTRIELATAKEQLKNIKELHVYQIEEMKLKLKILVAEEKKIKTIVLPTTAATTAIRKL